MLTVRKFRVRRAGCIPLCLSITGYLSRLSQGGNGNGKPHTLPGQALRRSTVVSIYFWCLSCPVHFRCLLCVFVTCDLERLVHVRCVLLQISHDVMSEDARKPGMILTFWSSPASLEREVGSL